ncbi:hypothetical protein AAC387_Pa03g2994 [Persea americana]
MGCAKVPIKLIECSKSRNKIFLKRIKGLKKKTYEFATLCGVDVCMICLEPQGEQQYKPQIWPDDPQEIRRIIKCYRGISNKEKDKRKLELLGFLKERNKKLEDKLNIKSEERADILYPLSEDQLNSLPEEVLQNLMVKLDSKIETVNKKIESLQGTEISVEIAPQTSLYHMQEMCGIYGINLMMGVDLMLIQPIQSVPISDTKPLDLCHMGMELTENSNIPTYNNATQIQPIQSVPIPDMKPLDLCHMGVELPENSNILTCANNATLQLPQLEGCFGNPGIEMWNNESILYSQTESCNAERCYGNPEIGMVKNGNTCDAEGCYENPENMMLNNDNLLYPKKKSCDAEGCYGNPGTGMLNNDNIFYSQTELFDMEGCYGNPGNGMVDNDNIFSYQTETSGADYFQSFMQFQSSFMEIPSSSSNSEFATYVNSIST